MSRPRVCLGRDPFGLDALTLRDQATRLVEQTARSRLGSSVPLMAKENSMIVDHILNAIVPGRADRQAKRGQEQKLDKELKETFPSSDPLASAQPGSGVTGPEVEPSELSPSQIAKQKGRKTAN
jgi:hypothetical protein